MRELGDEVDEQDLVALGDYQCYARLSAGSERLHVFSVQLDAPPASDPALSQRLAAVSAARFGRAATLVEQKLAAALERIEQARQVHPGQQGVASTADGPRHSTSGPEGKNTQQEPPTAPKARNEGRPARNKPSPQQAHFPLAGDSNLAGEGPPNSQANLAGSAGSPSEPGDVAES